MTSIAPRVATLPAAAQVPHLDVPADIEAKIQAAIASANPDIATFEHEHRPSERWMIGEWALQQLGFPPKGEEQAAELAYLHRLADSRTPDGIAAARFWSEHGLTDGWEGYLDEYRRKVGPAQARAASKLLHDTLMMVNHTTQVAKATSMRDRPFTVDPTLPLAVDKPGNNPSYPSGHTTAAFAAATVLAHLMPDRRAEFFDIAKQAAFARLYAGVHFPSDVMAGVKLATTMATYQVRHTIARPVEGTATVNPGVAGTRRRIPGAAQLAGERLPAA